MIDNQVIPKGTIAKCNNCGSELFRFEDNSLFEYPLDYTIVFDLQLKRMVKFHDPCVCRECGYFWTQSGGISYYYNNERL